MIAKWYTNGTVVCQLDADRVGSSEIFQYRLEVLLVGQGGSFVSYEGGNWTDALEQWGVEMARYQPSTSDPETGPGEAL